MGRQRHAHALTAMRGRPIGVTALGHDRCVVQRMEVGVGDSLDGCAAAVRRAGTVMRTHNLPHRPWPLWLRCGETRPELRRAASVSCRSGTKATRSRLSGGGAELWARSDGRGCTAANAPTAHRPAGVPARLSAGQRLLLRTLRRACLPVCRNRPVPNGVLYRCLSASERECTLD